MADALKGREVRPRRAGRRWVAGAVAAFLAIAIVASIVVLSDDEPSDAPPDASTGGATIPVNSLVQIEAEDSAILSVTPTSAGSGGDLPAVAVGGEGAVWMLVSGTLGRVDAADPAGIDAVTIGTINTTTSFALAERLVWAATDTGIARVSATDLRQLGVIELAEGSIVSAYVTARGGQVWAVVGNGQLTQIDPRTAEVIESIDVGQSASGITAGFDRVWVADDLTGTITPVGMETLQPGTPIAMPGDIDDLEAGAGAVWSLDTDAGVVTPIDPDTGALGSPVRVGVQPTDLASGLGALWVTNNGDGTISKVDQVTGGSTTLDVGAPVAGIAVDERGQELWVVVAVTH